jgi:serine protease Do
MKQPLGFRWIAYLLASLLLVALACNLPTGGGDEPAPPLDESDPPLVNQMDSGAISTLEDVRQAVIQIEAQGTFIDPEFGLLLNAAGTGSGFIVDPSGIAITNNHVVTGAALLKVWVGGDSEPRNARVLGVSECSDLAVIDIEGEDHPYLDWYGGQIDVGLEVYAAGFPLGDPEFTLTKGIVSKARAAGESDWASLDYVLEHDATINPGNSGGPLVDENGRVVGINYAASTLTSQYFAISRDVATGLIGTLQSGQDVDSVGVNGVAVRSDDGSLSGIWVASVASGSPADNAGVLPGDVISSMENLVLATDGSMADYCDILRTHGPDETLSIEVLRYQDGEYLHLQGQLNGRPLPVAGVFEQEIGDSVQDSGTTYTEYVQITDDFEAIVVEVPATWTEVDGRPWQDGEEVIGASIYAAPDLDGFLNTWTTPGVVFNVSNDLAQLGGYIQLLDIFREDFTQACELVDRYDYNDGYYRGSFDYFTRCGGSDGSEMLILSAVPIDTAQELLILVEVQILSDADVDAADRILATFDVIGALP